MMSTTLQALTAEVLARLLREAEQAHGAYERQLGHPDEDWPLWYARYMLGPLQELLAAGQSGPARGPEP
jgi:hypothetical protein